MNEFSSMGTVFTWRLPWRKRLAVLFSGKMASQITVSVDATAEPVEIGAVWATLADVKGEKA